MTFLRSLLGLLFAFNLGSACAQATYSFGVLPQRSATLTAQYWNPILEYAGRRAGVALQLKATRSGQESREAVKQGEYDFVYSNHFFQPAVASAGYRVILRPRELSIFGQIVVLENSPLRDIKELKGQPVGFPSAAAFIAYAVPADYLARQGVPVIPMFGGNQEGIMAQLKTGRVAAAGVNASIMQEYASRENLKYRVLWESPGYYNIPIAVHPRVPSKVVAAVQAALDEMEDTAEGRRILAESAAIVGQQPPFGFRLATMADYRNYTDFYQKTVLSELRQ